MKKRLKHVFAAAALVAVTLATGVGVESAAPAPSAQQCRTADKIINKQIRFAPGRTTAVIKDTIRLCTSHEYRLRARAGQTMSVNLAAGRRTSLTLSTPSGETLGDGNKSWSGELPESGEYLIAVGTDATARYTLEVTIR